MNKACRILHTDFVNITKLSHSPQENMKASFIALAILLYSYQYQLV